MPHSVSQNVNIWDFVLRKYPNVCLYSEGYLRAFYDHLFSLIKILLIKPFNIYINENHINDS